MIPFAVCALVANLQKPAALLKDTVVAAMLVRHMLHELRQLPAAFVALKAPVRLIRRPAAVVAVLKHELVRVEKAAELLMTGYEVKYLVAGMICAVAARASACLNMLDSVGDASEATIAAERAGDVLWPVYLHMLREIVL